MTLKRLLYRTGIVLIVAGVTLVLAPAGHAEFIFLSDGYVLRGKVQKEGTVLVDAPSGQELWSPKINGFYMVDDHARRVAFSQRHFVEAQPDPADRKQETFHPKAGLALGVVPGLVMSSALNLDNVSKWNADGIRTLLVNTGPNKIPMEQRITAITPTFVRVGARRYHWTCSFLPNEFDRQTLLTIIKTNQKKTAKPGNDELDDRIRVFRFCVQAGWYEEAEAELTGILTDFPDEKERMQERRKELRRLQAGQRWEEIELAHKIGQHQRAEGLLKDFPEDGAAAAIVTKVRTLRDRYKELNEKVATARRLLTAATKELKDAEVRAPLEEALAEIAKDLNVDTVPRLDAFLALALQEERLRQNNQKPELTAEQLAALAASGWILGNNGADQQAKLAARLWQARQFIARYLATTLARDRERMLEDYKKGQGAFSGKEALRFDVIAQLLQLLPPPVADKNPPAGAFDTEAKIDQRSKGINYRLQLPPEYHPHRTYPLLLVLHEERKQPRDMLARWSDLAAKQGYILAAPQWSDEFEDSYRFSSTEHEAVIQVIRDVRRRFNVDSERVFMAGFSQSGIMAYDVGLSHPDLFAGVIVMCGRPASAMAYKVNGQFLPFYVVEGEKEGQGPKLNRELFEYWIPMGFPSLYVEYTGRGYEFYPGELPFIFDWMSRKKRARAVPELGIAGGPHGPDFRTYRDTDNRFYWITTDQIDAVNQRPANPAKVSARIAEGNLIFAKTYGMRQLTVWLNSSMVDFDQPVDVRINPGTPNAPGGKKVVTPSLDVLLDDFYQRGDKQNLFVAKLEFRW